MLKKIIDLIRSWGGYEIYYEQNENSKKWNSKDEGYWGYPSLYFKLDTIFNLVPDEIVDSIVNKDKTFGLYYLDFYKYLDLDQVYIPYENEEGLLFPFFQFLNLPIDIFTPPLKLIPKLFKYKIRDIHNFINDPKLDEWLWKLYKICKKIYSKKEYAFKQYHLENWPLYIYPSDEEKIFLEELKYRDEEAFKDYIRSKNNNEKILLEYKRNENLSWNCNYFLSLLNVSFVDFWSGYLDIKAKKTLMKKLILLKKNIQYESESWSKQILLWNINQLLKIISDSSLFKKYTSQLMGPKWHQSRINYAIIINLDNPLYAYRLFSYKRIYLDEAYLPQQYISELKPYYPRKLKKRNRLVIGIFFLILVIAGIITTSIFLLI